MLLSKGANINASDYKDGLTPLCCAAKQQSLNVMKILIEHKADVQSRDFMGKTPLVHCAGNAECTLLLLQYGADPKLTDKDGTCLPDTDVVTKYRMFASIAERQTCFTGMCSNVIDTRCFS
jgi:ankyrin repeat protein